MKRFYFFILISALLALTGCIGKDRPELSRPTLSDYDLRSVDTVTATMTDATPTVELVLKSHDTKKVDYRTTLPEPVLESVNIKEGDQVQAGDVMVTFASEGLEKKMKESEDRLEEDRLLIEHYENLAKLEPGNDYSEEIKEIQADAEIAAAYAEDYRARMASYNLIAEGNGVVSSVHEMLSYGVAFPGYTLFSVTYSDNQFVAETSEDYDFKVGEVYPASFAVSEYDMELLSVEEVGKEDDGRIVKRLTFTFADHGMGVADVTQMNMRIERATLKNVVMVPEYAVFSAEDGHDYVYKVNEEGYRHAVEVEAGEIVGSERVILKGISDGDRVVKDAR